jgi:hypothetical protein
LALGIRLLYQSESQVDVPLRADAGKYFSAAYNLRYLGIHSEAPPLDDEFESRTDLPPGYPLFLTLFLSDTSTLLGFLRGVLRTQAVLGSLTVVWTFLLARLCLRLPWAITAAALTALNPHLVAMDGYVLTESLFTFLLMLGTLVFALAWRDGRALFALAAGVILASSAQVRTISYLLPFFLAPVFLLHPRRRSYSTRAVWAKQLALLLLGFVIVTAAHREFVKETVTHEGSVVGQLTERGGEPARREVPKHYVTLRRAWSNLKESIRPPVFFVKGASHVYDRRLPWKKEWKHRSQASFREEPAAYLKWHLGGKFRVMWHWDNAYNGDVYIYPMKRKGFHENSLLARVHGTMRVLHWPLYLLSLAAVLVFLVRWRRGELPAEARALLVPALGFVYLVALLSIFWFPRYSIPARPFSFILAAAFLSWLRRGSRGRPVRLENS